MLMNKNKYEPTNRFSNRVADYIKYRPGYPSEILTFLKSEIGFGENWTVADIGSGTGLLSELFLKNGNDVFGVEPNDEMRLAGEKYLNKYSGFISLNGTAESIPVEDNSIDLITAGQAFHWFDVEKSKREFIRILKPECWVILVWNERLTDADTFAKEYENLLLEYSIDYKTVDHRNINNKILGDFFTSYKLKIFPNKQEFDFEGLKGRLLSSSYVPKEEHPNYQPMMKELKKIFNENQLGRTVNMKYDTQVYYGKVK